MNTANGFLRANTVMSGNLSALPFPATPIGRRIVTDNGVGSRLTVGLGLTTNLGVGRHIITGAGFGITAVGIGHLIRNTVRGAVGGDRL